MPVDFKKLRKQLEKELEKTGLSLIGAISLQDRKRIGIAAIEEIKTLVSKGVSPIAGRGRFPAYKGVSASAAINKTAKSLTGSRKKRARQIASDLKKKFYPYTVQGKFPDKRERPVNLFLSGDFLSNLNTKIIKNGVEIGFYDEKSVKKESGHREGVNGQPPRPILPQGNEKFSESIYQRVVALLTSIVKR
jgi:hypothetical protein